MKVVGQGLGLGFNLMAMPLHPWQAPTTLLSLWGRLRALEAVGAAGEQGVRCAQAWGEGAT